MHSAFSSDPSPAMPPVARPRRWRQWTLGLAWSLVIGWAVIQAGFFQRDLINEGGWTLVWRFIQAAFHPDLTPAFLQLTAQATLTTLAYAVVGTALSLVVGCSGAVMASQVWWSAVAGSNGRLAAGGWTLTRTILAFPRGIHELLWGLFFVNIFGLDPLTAVLAIAIPFGAIVAKVFAEIFDEMPQEPFQALLNSGVSPFKAFLYTLVPQALPDLLAYAFYRFECSIRAAAVLGIIGAGGLGYQILLSLQTLRYEEMWTLFLALFLLSGSTDWWSTWLRRRLGTPATEGTTRRGQRVGTEGTPHLDRGVRGSLFVIALLLPLSLWYIQADWTKLWSPDTARLWQDIAQRAWPLRLAQVDILALLRLAARTLAMSVLAALVASGGGLLLSFPAAHNVILPGGIMRLDSGTRWRRRGRWLMGLLLLSGTRFLLLVLRAIPAPIWALILLYVLFPGILPGAAALALYNMGVLGRLMAEVVENQDKRPLLALKAQGAPAPQVFFYGILPATLPRFISYSLYRWEIAIRATFIVGLVGAGGLGRLLTEQLSRFDYRGVVVTLVIYIGLTFLVDLISAFMRKSIKI